MAIKRPAPKQLSVETQNAIITSSAAQTTGTVRVKSYDPNFPVFEVPINQKVLAYVPNHIVMTPDGQEDMRKDAFNAHAIIDGRSFGNVRCTQGLRIDELGLDETCPLCDGMQELWELYHYQYNDIARSKGISVDAPEAQELLKQDRIDLVRGMQIQPAEKWYTFPIVVIDCEEKDGQFTTVPKKDGEGRLSGKPMWYSIRERTYKDKWESAFDSFEAPDGSVPSHPAGQWVVLNFTYTPKSGQHDKMGSARALKVTIKPMGDAYTQWATYFDQLTADWTPAKAMETVVLDVLRDMNEQKEVADTLLKPVRDKLALYKLSGSAQPQPQAIPQATSAEAALANFGGTPVEPQTPPAGLTTEVPVTGVE